MNGNATNAANADAVDGKSANELVRLTRSAGGINTLALTDADYQTVASVQITVPAAGFVLVTSSTIIESGDGFYQIRLRDVTTGTVTAQLVVDITPENLYIPVSPTHVFQVAGTGARTFQLEARRFSGTNGSATNATITALYVPFGSTGAGTLDVEEPAPASGTGPSGR